MRERVRRLLQRPGTVDLAPFRRIVRAAGEREAAVAALDDEALRAAVTALPTPFRDAELIEFCALAREAAVRALGERPYDVQLLAVLALLSGHVSESGTGEGKTLAGAIAAAGFALQGRRVHVMSVNDYLARRDATWMAPVYERFGVSVASIGQSSTSEDRRAAYAAKVMYAPVSEIGFDVLRDRLVTDPAEVIVPEPQVALIDEADSVLVDEARVPLVLAGAAQGEHAAPVIAQTMRTFLPGVHFEVDDERRSAHLTERGTATMERVLGLTNLYGEGHVEALAAVNTALHAHALLRRDVDYLVRDGKVGLIDGSRGRVAKLQRWPDGLQAAVEAKESLPASESGEVLDSLTIQSLVGRYPTVCGMTGTALAVAGQLREFYRLDVAVIPPNRECVRVDEPDRLFATAQEKQDAIVAQIVESHRKGRPILIGTLDVAESERLAMKLRLEGLACKVLNAANDAEEAAVIARAGECGAITVSTQMAGRGTDIRLGKGAAEAGGLYVIGTGRYPASRLDDQLRGRAGRQGDPGASVFFVSLEDHLITAHVPESTSISTWTVGHAQRVAEGLNLEIHRGTWGYNKLIEYQRSLVLTHRDRLLREDLAPEIIAGESPEDFKRVRTEVGEKVANRAARLIMLHHLDECWSGHLAYLGDLREGIHLRVLGRQNPLDEFNAAAVTAFKRIENDTRTRSAETFTLAKFTENGVDLEASGIRRPTATWTYLVKENPFGTEAERILARLGRTIRGGGRERA
ncbi:accessory Sec system translocase SecA2 [Rhizohabitans arisaemae]|uniref:accessory Sec system translocase SecA2 n=1 Tax=Rhizohabitans arisaemae TaxID=2720610 RepID=UPI0024B09876|nr:accessory Sec system translocase SecA2 [Rhizohabitans arisaemae]